MPFKNIVPFNLKKEIKISSFIHAGIILLIITCPLIFPHKYKYQIPRVHSVDLVNLPVPNKKTIPTTKAPKPKPIVKKTVPKPTIKPRREKIKKTAIKHRPAPAALKTPTLEERLNQKLKTPSRATAADKISSPAYTTAAPQLTTSISSQQDFPFQYYLDLIHNKISSCWQEPEMVMDRQYTAVISFTINTTGRISNVRIKRSSGINMFDKSGARAIELAKPFPPLPPGYKDSQLTINVAFNLT